MSERLTSVMAELAVTPGAVAVLCGGPGPEREVSLNSGKNAYQGLLEAGVKAELVVVPAERPEACLENLKCRVAVLMLHGEFGEDGGAQTVLERRGVAFTGSSAKTSSLAMDKNACKVIFQANGIPTARWATAASADAAPAAVAKAGLAFPLFVKPNYCGSSVGVSRVNAPQELSPAVQKALTVDSLALIEEMVVGREFTVSWLDGKALPIIELQAEGVFYDYEAKYLSDKTRYVCPAKLDGATEEAIKRHVLAVARLLGARDIGRVDVMLGESGPKVLELNTLPGFTTHSLVPMAARAAGMSLPTLCLKLVEMAAGRMGDSETAKRLAAS